MARTSTYLNFDRETEAAFNFYKTVFGTEFTGILQRFGEVPPQPGQPPLAEADKHLLIHISLPILGGHILHGTDAPASMGFTVTFGNTMHLNLEPDTRTETDRLYQALSAGGKVIMPLKEMFWGGYFGHITDKFGVSWMFNCESKT